MRRHPPHVLGILLVLLLSACAQTRVLTGPRGLPPGGAEARVLLMQPDIELYEITAGGLLEPKAEWTARATEHVTSALGGVLRIRNVTLVSYQPPAQDPARQHAHTQLVKLHDVVGGTILRHKYNPGLELPTKKDLFDWSLGQGVGILREEHTAEYALFVLFRDSYVTPGRVALMMGAALLGVGIPGGQQVGIASLVDLRSGEIVWFNRLFNPAGDLRTPEAAEHAVKHLLKGFPL